LARGRAYGVTNFVSRPITGIAPILTEYTDKPLYFVCGFAFLAIFTIPMIKILESEMRESDKAKDKNVSQIDNMREEVREEEKEEEGSDVQFNKEDLLIQKSKQ